jgi:transcriptional antiterminator
MGLNFDYADSKTAVVNLEFEGQVHRSVLTDDEKSVLVYYAQENYPRWAIYAASVKEYVEIIEGVAWIKNNLTEEEKEILQDLKSKEEVK